MDYLIETNFQGSGFVAVPNHVVDDEHLSPDALGVLVWLARRPVGFIARTVSIRERFGIGKDRWQRIARELRTAGAIQRVPVRLANGAFSGWRYEVRWPEPVAADEVSKPISRETRPMVHKPGLPAAGKPANYCRKTRQLLPGNPAPYKDKDKDLEPAAAVLDLDLKEPVAPSRGASDPAQVDVAALSGFQRTQFLRGDASVQVARRPVLFGSPEYSRVVELLGNGVM